MFMILSRLQAMKLGLRLFWSATGTPRVGVEIQGKNIELMGDDVLRERLLAEETRFKADSS